MACMMSMAWEKGVWYSCEMHVMMHMVRGTLYANCCTCACIPYENLKWVLLKYKEMVASEEVVVKCRKHEPNGCLDVR